MSANFNVSPSPHIRDRVKSSNIMLFVVIALLPATFFGIYNFRHENAWLLVLVTTASAVLAEYIYEKLMHKPVTIQDFSAVVTGLLLALNLPPTLPLWMGALGSVFAIIVVKQLFGGLGQNFMNPALGARCFLLISFTGKMTYFVYDGVTGPTPLANLRAGEAVNTFDMMMGNIRGTIGETSVIAIMIGAMFLILMGVIDLRIPGTYIVTFVIFITLFGGHGFDPQYITAHLCGGEEMIPAAGQGILAVQARAGEYQELLEVLNDPRSEAAAKAERAFVKVLNDETSGIFLRRECSITGMFF